jgi:hypothetical protein
VHLIKAELEPIELLQSWFKKLRSVWDLRLDHLENLLKEGNSDDK